MYKSEVEFRPLTSGSVTANGGEPLDKRGTAGLHPRSVNIRRGGEKANSYQLICAYFKKPFLHEEILQVIEDFAAPEPRREEGASCQ